MQELDQPIEKPTEIQHQRRLQSAFRAQFQLEEFARLVRDMRVLQVERGFGIRGIGSVQTMEGHVDEMVKSILNL